MSYVEYRYLPRNMMIPASPPVVAFDPTQVTGLLAWYDASDTATITASSGAVSQWNDKSGNGRDVTQATGANQPITGTRTINGLNTLDFDGSNDTLSRSSVTIAQPWTIFAAVLCDTPANQNAIFCGSAARTHGIWGGIGGMWSGLGSSSVGGPAVNTAAHVLSWVITGGNTDQRLDGGTSATGNPGTNNIDNLFIGTEGGGLPFDGIMGELIWYDSAFNSTNRGLIEAYLKAKWGTP